MTVEVAGHGACTDRSMKLCCIVVGLAACLAPTAAMAQDSIGEGATRRLVISDRAIAAGMAATPSEQTVHTPRRKDRDSVWNGAIIGAVIGAVATAAFVGTLCKALQEPSDPSCVPTGLTAAALGAGVGAAAGAGIDALAARSKPYGIGSIGKR